MKDLQFALLIIICLVTEGTGYPSCSIIEFADYSYDLSSLKNVTVSIKNDDQYAKYYPCLPDSCSQDSISQKSFLLKGLTSNCETYSSNCLLIQSIQLFSPTITISIPPNLSWVLGSVISLISNKSSTKLFPQK